MVPRPVPATDKRASISGATLYDPCTISSLTWLLPTSAATISTARSTEDVISLLLLLLLLLLLALSTLPAFLKKESSIEENDTNDDDDGGEAALLFVAVGREVAAAAFRTVEAVLRIALISGESSVNALATIDSCDKDQSAAEIVEMY